MALWAALGRAAPLKHTHGSSEASSCLDGRHCSRWLMQSHGAQPLVAPRAYSRRQHAARLQVVAQAATIEQVQPHMVVLPAPEPSRMVNDNHGFVEQHRIRGYEAGPNQRATISTIANTLQEVASNHAVAMWGRSEEGFASDPELADKGLIFVMTRLQIQMDDYPKWGDVVRVETWFMPAGKIGAQRDFLISCGNTGRPLGRATSSWVLLNIRTRRLSKVPDSFREKCMCFVDEGREAMTPSETRQKLPDLALPAEIEGPVQMARRSDIDMNGHVNNVTYLAWALETVPLEIHNTHHLYQVEIDYKAECHCGDKIESLAQRCPPPDCLLASNGSGNGNGSANNGNGAGAGAAMLAFTHGLRRCEGDNCTELVRMRSVWRAQLGQQY